MFHSKEEFAAAVRKETETLRQQVCHTCRQINLIQVGPLVAKLQIGTRSILVGSLIFRIGAEFDFRWLFHQIQIPIHVLMNQRFYGDLDYRDWFLNLVSDGSRKFHFDLYFSDERRGYNS